MVALLVAGADGRVRVLHEGDGVGTLVVDLAGAERVWWGEKGSERTTVAITTIYLSLTEPFISYLSFFSAFIFYRKFGL